MKNNERVTRFLIEKNVSISFMESCTSGLLASMLTDTEGASAIFKGSDVTYSNEAKVMAGVDKAIIEKYGVYSPECAREMALIAKKKYDTDVAVGITGTTGNVDPKNLDSAQGIAYFFIIIKEQVETFTIEMDVKNLSRKAIKEAYAEEVYNKLAELLGA